MHLVSFFLLGNYKIKKKTSSCNYHIMPNTLTSQFKVLVSYVRINVALRMTKAFINSNPLSSAWESFDTSWFVSPQVS